MSSAVHFSKESGGGFTKKKLFGLLFAICILIGLLTATALAEEVQHPDTAYFRFFNKTSYTYQPGHGDVIYLKTNSSNATVATVTAAEDHDIILSYDKNEGKATITLKETTINAEGSNTYVIGLGNSANKDFSVDIVVSGNCTIAGINHAIRSYVNGDVTIRGDDDTTEDHLTLTANNSSSDRRAIYSDGDAHLVIDGVKVTAKNPVKYNTIKAASVTIQNSAEVTVYSNNNYAIQADSGDVQVINSTLTMSNYINKPLIYLADTATQSITFENSTVIGANGTTGGYMFSNAPNFTECLFEGSTAVVSVDETTGSFTEPEAELTEYDASLTANVTGKYHYFKITPCAHEHKVALGGDCRNGLKCDDCGAAIPDSASSGHTGPEQTNCEEAVLCTNPGCTQTVHPAGTHTPGAEDSDCSTPVECTVCHTIVYEAQTHSSAAICGNTLYGGGTCTHERKQAYVKLVNNELTLTDGQTKYYRTNDVEGKRYPITAGVTPENATIIITYNETENKVTVTLKGVALDSITSGSSKTVNAFTFGSETCKNFNVDIEVEGACTLDASIANNAYLAIESNITGDLTIRGDNREDDSLTIIDKSTSGNPPAINVAKNLAINYVALTVRNIESNTSTGSSAIVANDVTIQNSNVNLYSYAEHAINAAGNVLVEDSTLTMSSVNSEVPLVNATGTITIADSTVTAGAGDANGTIFNKAPVISPYGDGFKFRGSESKPTVSAADATTDAVINESGLDLEKTYAAGIATTYKYFYITPCNHSEKVLQGEDCTKDLKCADCGKIEVGSAQPNHIPEADDNDCTTPTHCGYEGCTQVYEPAPEHPEVPDDGKCNTAVICPTCGKTIFEAQEHAYNSGEAQCKNELHDGTTCTHTRKLAYVKLVRTELILADGESAYYTVGADNYPKKATEDEQNAPIIISYDEDENKVTVRLKNVTIECRNSNYSARSNFIFGNNTYYDFAVDIEVDGACTLDSANGVSAIESYITGVLTIKGDDRNADSLTIMDTSASSEEAAVKLSGNLKINDATVTVKNISNFGGSAIVANDVAIDNSDVTLFSYFKHAINATGDVLVEDSTLTMSSVGSVDPLINVTDENTITITNSTVTAGVTTQGGSIFSKQPELYSGFVFEGSASAPTVSVDAIDKTTITEELDTVYDAARKYRYFHIEPCTGHEFPAELEDCTQGLKCIHCNYYQIAPKDHTWADGLDTECDVCGQHRALTPSYTITIPASITTSNGEPVTVTFAASDIENLADGHSLLVSVAGGLSADGKITLTLQDNDTIKIDSQMSIDGETVNTATPEVVSFTADGEQPKQIAFAVPEDTQFAGTYTGTITFGVSWVQGGNAA